AEFGAAMTGTRSFYDPVGAQQKPLRDGQAERLRRPAVDHQLELGRLLDWEVAWARPLEDLVHVRRGPSPQIAKVGSVGHQAAGDDDKLALVVHRRQAVRNCKLHDPGSIREEQAR